MTIDWLGVNTTCFTPPQPVFKVKRNGVYHARLVAKGFSQIHVVYFTDNYSPVVNDVTFRVVVARMLIEDLKGKVVDIDNAF